MTSLNARRLSKETLDKYAELAKERKMTIQQVRRLAHHMELVWVFCGYEIPVIRAHQLQLNENVDTATSWQIAWTEQIEKEGIFY